MSNGPPARVEASIPALLRLAWPIIISRSTQMVVGLADALMVAHLGDTALAATTTGAMNVMAVFLLPMGTTFIISSFASQYYGKGDLAGARRYPFYGFAIAGFTQVLGLLILPLLPTVLGHFDYAPDVRATLQQYIQVRLLAGGVVVGLEALTNYYAGIGNTRVPMLANVAAMVLNVVGNWLLIDGHLGLPALGVAGAAWASVASTAVAFCGLLVFFLRDGLRQPHLSSRLSGGEFLRVLRFGVPAGLNWFFEFLATLFFINVVVTGLGTQMLAAFMAVNQLNTVASLVGFAMTSAGAVVVGQAIGAGARDEVPRTVRLTFLLSGGWQALMGVFYLLAPEWVFAPFAQGEQARELLALGARVLMLAATWQIFDAAACTLAEALRAAGDTAFTLWARLALAWALFVPGVYANVRWFGGREAAAMLWMMIYFAALAGVLLVRFRSGAWQRFELVQR
ncbi:MATE family efflux transporter [Archangium violaceum]|uniref:MATE family efflux transporter n=1 Tax=Archangium violaceum TaxID=83451 RepID=UPI0019525F1C|nr:MATE family efflux transporter [Archangium violaceum]QRN95002.1 MATE family efflux transporter [Archangium violaceum]